MLAGTLVLLSLVFPPFYCFFLAPFALVPMCVCIIRRPLRWSYLGLYYALGCIFFLLNTMWLAPVTVGGYIALSLFVGLYFPLFAAALHRLMVQLRLPGMIAVPMAWTAVEFLRASFVLGGFPWFLLGNCLTPAPLLIQTADIWGVWGLSFLLAMLNGYCVDVLRLPLRQPMKDGKSRFTPLIARLTSAVALAVFFTIAYGVYCLNQGNGRANAFAKPGPVVAVIQENFPQELKDDRELRDKIFIRHLELTQQAARAQPRPDLIVWPETMVTAPINQELIDGTPDSFQTIESLRQLLASLPDSVDGEMRRIDDYYKALNDLANRENVALLVGYSSYLPRTATQPVIMQNRTLLIQPASRALDRQSQPRQEYSKMHLVPFGEYIPFHDIRWLNRLLLSLTPLDFDYSNQPGNQWTRFHLTVRHSFEQLVPRASSATASASAASQPGLTNEIVNQLTLYTFGTPICFEDAMPEPSRRLSAADPAHHVSKADFLLNVSNDGWFWPIELDQHLQACQIRAVENRVPIARSVNTGNSGFIDSNGRIIKLVTDANGKSIHAVGTAAIQLPLDSRISVYSQIGDLLPILCGIATALLVAWTLVRPRLGKRAQAGVA